jgi:hypothetical protein
MTTKEINSVEIIEKYIGLKSIEKAATKDVDALKKQFTAACDVLLSEVDQIEVAGALVVKRVTPVYEYDESVLALKAAYERAKKEFEESTHPINSIKTKTVYAVTGL